MSAELLFWTAHLPLMLLLLAGLGYIVRLWSKGKATSGPRPARDLLSLLRAFVTEAWFNRRLWRNDRWRWAAHFMLLTGFLLLMTLSGIAALSEKVLYHLLHLGHIPWISMWYTADHPVTALLNEIGGVLMTVGFLFFVVRRYVLRPAQLRTGPMDHWMVVGLGLILLTGWITEVVRLNSSHIGPAPHIAFIGYPLSRLVANLPVAWDRWFDALYLVHGLLTSAIIATIPFSKFMHAIAGGLTTVLNEVVPPAFIPARPPASPGDSFPYTRRQMIELDGCTRCGECVIWCPTFAEKPDRDGITPLVKTEKVRSFVRREHSLRPRPPDSTALQIHSEDTYDCTLCGRCGIVCPVHIDTRHLWIAMREDLVQRGVYPEALNHLRETVTTHHNISGDPNAERLIWSQNLDRIPDGVGKKDRAEVVYFVGCVSSFYPQTYSVPQSMVEILDQAGMDFVVLGPEEWCCGFPLIIAGMGKAAVESVRHNVDAVRRTGAKWLVATCPSCYHTWKHDYPRILGEPLGFEVLHATELLAEILREGRLHLQPFEQTVTYHDPCDLGRTSGVYEAPREVIRAIPGVTLVEMEHHHEYSLCCGGGGDVEMADKGLTEAVARRRIQEAQATGAKVLLSACQQCKRTLMGAARREKVRVRVMDVVELVARQLGD